MMDSNGEKSEKSNKSISHKSEIRKKNMDKDDTKQTEIYIVNDDDDFQEKKPKKKLNTSTPKKSTPKKRTLSSNHKEESPKKKVRKVK